MKIGITKVKIFSSYDTLLHAPLKRLRLLFFIFIICTIPSFVLAQAYSYVNYDVKDGLAGSTVYSMVQDKDGFIWFGTETGLSRFDGTHFKNFSTLDGLPDNEIIKLFVDSKNRVWIVPFRNSLCYYQNGEIHNADNDTLLKKITLTSELISIVENGSHDLLIMEMRALHIIGHTGNIYQIDKIAGRPIGAIKAGLNKDLDFRVATVFQTGLDLIISDIHEGSLSVVQKVDSSVQTNYNGVFLNPLLQVNMLHGALHFTYTKNNSEFNYSMSEGFINACSVSDSTFAFNYANKTLLFDALRKKIVDSFSVGQPANNVIRDSEGSLWFSTMGKGVYRLASSEFENYSFNAVNNHSAVFCIQKIDSTFYIGTENFLVWALNRNLSVIRNNRIQHWLTRGRIITVTKVSKNRLIVGSDYGLIALDNWHVKQFYPGVAVKDVFSEADGKIVASTSRFTVRLDPLQLKLVDTVWGDRSTCAYKMNGTFYIGTLNGLYAVHQDKTFSFMGDSNEVFKTRIAALTASRDGTLWIATSGNGLIAYRDGKMIQHLTTNNGLTSNICRNIFVTAKDVWTGTDKGLNRVSATDTGYAITTFTTGDGLKSDIINAVYVDSNQVFLGTPEGLTRFDMNKKGKNSGCRLYITGIVVSGKKMQHNQTDFILPHRDNNIAIEFVGISYKSAGDITYKYKLSPDTTWKITNQTTLNYPSLASGEYTLELSAVNKFGVESNQVKIQFTVEKLLREKFWFQATILLFAIAVAGFFVYLRIRNLKEKEAQKITLAEKMGELEQMALRSQMNPHFIFNSLNSIQQYVIDKDILGANEFITQFSRLIRLTLDLSSKLDISLDQEIIYLSTYLDLEKKRFENKFSYEVIVENGIDREDYAIPTMILQPYIENCVRHGMRYKKDLNGKIHIRFAVDSKYLVCNIEDNGIGRKQALQFKSIVPVEYQSKGMTLTARRIELFNNTHGASILINIEDLEDLNKTPGGTRVTISFPLQEAYRPNNIQ